MGVTSLGHEYFFLAAIPLLWICLGWKNGARISVIVLITLLINFWIKEIVKLPRPFVTFPDVFIREASGYSFPSGHAVQSLLFFAILVLIFKDKIKNNFQKYFFVLVNIIIILLVGWSRIYLKTHYWVDVMAGYAFGIIWLIFISWLIKRKVFKKIF